MPPYPISPGFTSGYFATNPFAIQAAPPPEPTPTKLLPGDVRTLIAVMDGAVRDAPITPAQRTNFTAILGRLRGAATSLPPSMPAALEAFFTAFTERNPEHLLTAGNGLLDAVVLAGDMNAAASLQGALQRYTATMVAYLEGAPVKGAATKLADGVLAWHEPNPGLFYVLDNTSGVVIAEVLEDLRHADIYVARGAPVPNRMYFDGPPGCGKTEAAKYIAGQLGRPLAVLMLAKLISKYIGETGERFHDAVKAAQERNAVLLIDELDTVGGHREQAEGGASDHTAKVVGAINQALDDCPADFVIIGATNLPSGVDPSVARRLEMRVTFANPDRAARETMARKWWGKAPYTEEAFEALVTRTDGKSGDAVRRAANVANRAAGRRGRLNDRGAEEPISIGDVMGALARLTKEASIGEAKSSLLLGVR